MGDCGSKGYRKGIEGATLLIHLHGKRPRVEMPEDMAFQERTDPLSNIRA